MSDEGKANTESSSRWTLENIPVELFLQICSYLDARFITHSLSLVCKRFHEILLDESIWKSRITQRWGSMYPPLPVESDEFNWRQACVCIEDQYEMWHRKEMRMRPILRKDIHYASVDAIHLMQNAQDGMICISGSRDRSILVWNLSNALEGSNEVPCQISADAHKGWIWSLASCDGTLYSCSWDTTVRSWEFGPTLQPVSMFQTAVLSLVCNINLVAAGTYTRAVKLFDTRVGESQVNSYTTHRSSVLALAMSNDLIVSASEDQTVAVWDQRAGKVLKQMKLYEQGEHRTYPMCLSFDDNLLYVGDSKGQLLLLNPAQGQFNIVKVFEVGHTRKVTCVKHGMGCIITGSTDGTVRISTPTQEPQTIAIITSQGGEVTSFDYKNNVLAIGGTDSAVEFWMPCSS